MQNKFLSILLGLSVASIVGAERSEAAIVTFQGVFDSTTPVCSSTDICTGLGTSSFSYGSPAVGSFSTNLAFTGQTYPSIPTGNFNVGTLTITNGVIFGGTYPAFSTTATDSLTFINLKVTDTDNTKSGNFLIGYNSTTNFNPVLNSAENADYIFFPLNPDYGAFYIREGATLSDAIASVGILAEDPPAVLFARGFQALPGQTNGFIAALPPGAVDPRTGYFIPNATTSVPEPFTLVGTLLGGTLAFKMRKKLKAKS
jgi:hypothetical protein